MDTVLLIDFMNFSHRANIKFKSTGDQQNFTVVFNFFRNLRALIEQLNPNRVFLCLEGSNNFRYGLLPTYKANRIVKTGGENKQKSNDDFRLQTNKIQQLCKLLPIEQCRSDTFEADDVIYTLASNLKEETPIVVSNDNDLWQILQEKALHRTKVYDPFKKEFVVAPKLFHTVFKALNGDISDNIPRLVSEEKAMELTANPRLLREFLSNEENKQSFNLNLDVVRLRLIPNDGLEFTGYDVDYNGLRVEFEAMAFHSFFKGDYWERFINTFKCLR